MRRRISAESGAGVGRPETRGGEAGPPPDIVIITGMSGAGRSTAAKSLEDLDWFVADNLPPGLLPTMIDLARRAKGAVPRIAAVMDVRSRAFTTDLQSAIGELAAQGVRPRVVFLEASDDTLVRRFEGVRRPHPLQEDGRVVDGIAAERALLHGVRENADLVLDTSALNVHELRARMINHFAGDAATAPRVSIVSFGFKYGLPVDADIVADCRFLPNPRWVEELVKKFVLSQPGAAEFLESYLAALRVVLAGYEREGKHFVTLAIGCTGGKHRSVAVAEEIAESLAGDGAGVQVVHRDLGRE